MAEPTLEAQVASLTDATTALLNAVNVSKSTLDSSKNTAVSSAAAAAASESAAELAKAAAESAATSAEAVSGFTTQDNVADVTPGRIVLVDYNADSAFDRICKIAGMAPTLYMNFKEQDYRHYSSTKGLEKKALADILTFTRDTGGGIFNARGQYEALSTNEPRLDFDPETGICRGLLVEESRTNLLTYSQEFDNADWNKSNATITANAAIAPDGTLTADKLIETASLSEHRVSQSKPITGAACGSVYVKVGERSRVYLQLFNAVDGIIASGSFNIITEAQSSVIGTTFFERLNDGWVRVGVLGSASHSSAVLYITIVQDGGNLAPYTGDGTSGLYIWGAQLEEGSFPTSYIPTTTAAATRAADVASITGTTFSDFYNPSEGSMLAIGTRPTVPIGFFPRLLSFNNGSTADHISLGYLSEGSSSLLVFREGVGQTELFQPGFTGIRTRRSAAAYASSDFAISTNGSTPLASVSGTLPSVNQLIIGLVTATTYNLNGEMPVAVYFPKRLPNATLQQLSALVI